jgi:hypothetical protein
MAQWLRALTALPEILSSIPATTWWHQIPLQIVVSHHVVAGMTFGRSVSILTC